MFPCLKNGGDNSTFPYGTAVSISVSALNQALRILCVIYKMFNVTDYSYHQCHYISLWFNI